MEKVLVYFGFDWCRAMTKKEFEDTTGLRFKGPGWNLDKKDTALVESAMDTGKSKGKYMVYVWNRPNARESFKETYEFPVKECVAKK